MRIITAIFFLLFLQPSQAQLSAKDAIELRKLLLVEVNQLRDSLGLPALLEDESLQKAAFDHSKYMAKNKELSHEEKGPGRTVAKRVRRAGSRDFQLVGENILYTEVANFKLNRKKLEALAREMYLQWRNSPGHFRNMSQQAYVFGDIGIAADSKNGRIYATQVFGTKGYKVEGQLSRSAWGVRATRQECEAPHTNILTNMCSGIEIRNDSIFMYYHDIARVRQYVTGVKDGFAVDLIDKSQMPCGGPNLLDASKIYDGIMLEPVYRDELIQGNIAEGMNRIITCLGVVPESLRGKELAVGMIYIKNGSMCEYMIPAYAPSRPYVLEPFEPKMIEPEISLQNEVIGQTEELEFDFQRGALESTEKPNFEIPEDVSGIHSVKILSYSSVEGSTERNIGLHQNRAKFIEAYIRQKTKGYRYDVEVDAQENWRKMDFQLRYNFADSLLELSHEELKQFIASGDTSLPWDKLLFEQRSSRAFINYTMTLDPIFHRDYLPYTNLVTAIVQENDDLANKAMYEMYHDEDVIRFIFDEQVFDALLKRKDLVQNAAAVISRDYYQDWSKAVMFVHAWASRLNELSTEARENVLHLYSILGYDLVQEWDVSAKRLSNVIHPSRLEGLINNSLPEEIMLNANLTFVYYYGHTLEREGLDRSFEFVKSYMDERSLSEEKLTKLVWFFNDWSRYDLTNEYLMKSWEKGVLSEENTFVLAHTLTRYQREKYKDQYMEIMRKALELDQERWCEWVGYEFQIMRDHEIKQMFCSTCPN